MAALINAGYAQFRDWRDTGSNRAAVLKIELHRHFIENHRKKWHPHRNREAENPLWQPFKTTIIGTQWIAEWARLPQSSLECDVAASGSGFMVRKRKWDFLSFPYNPGQSIVHYWETDYISPSLRSCSERRGWDRVLRLTLTNLYQW